MGTAMIRVGCQYSSLLTEALQLGRLEVDYIKMTGTDLAAGALSVALRHAPVLLHHLPSAGSAETVWEQFDFGALNAQIEQARSPHIAVHLELTAADWGEPVVISSQEPNVARRMVARLVENYQAVRERTTCPVLFENVPYTGTGGSCRITVEPAVMWHLAAAEGVGMLLDTSHLRCTADHLGIDALAYARSLPLQAVREVHVSGPRLIDGCGLMDSHAELREIDYGLLEWVLGHCQPEVVTLEYGYAGREDGPTYLAAVERQVARLHTLTAGR